MKYQKNYIVLEETQANIYHDFFEGTVWHQYSKAKIYPEVEFLSMLVRAQEEEYWKKLVLITWYLRSMT